MKNQQKDDDDEVFVLDKNTFGAIGVLGILIFSLFLYLIFKPPSVTTVDDSISFIESKLNMTNPNILLDYTNSGETRNLGDKTLREISLMYFSWKPMSTSILSGLISDLCTGSRDWNMTPLIQAYDLNNTFKCVKRCTEQ